MSDRVDAPYELLETLEPGIARVLARNPSAFTYYGTQTYLIGERGDRGDRSRARPARACRGADPGDRRAPRRGDHVHAHPSRSQPGSAAACERRPARRSSAARRSRWRPSGPRADAAFDGDYSPDRILEDGESVEVDGRSVVAVATPGHTSNHLCFAVGDALLTGDHVMGWSTTVVVPPDGEMAAYMASLDKLRQREDRIFYPAHGPPVTNPQQYVRGLMGHRMQREKQILRLVGEQPRDIPDIVANAYPGLDPRLVNAAGGSVLAHLLDLEKRGLVVQSEQQWSKAA